MSSPLNAYAVVKASALFALFTTIVCFCLPARAADQVDINAALAQLGEGVLFWVFILFVVIMVAAFHDGKSRETRPDKSQDPRNKLPD